MTDPAETKAERCDRMLGELAELGMAVARDLAARAQAAETPEEATQLALAFHRVSRSLRQTLALDAKLTRDAAQAEREAAVLQARQDEARALARHRRHKDAVRAGVERLIWAEAEDDDAAEELLTELEERLGNEAVTEGFEDTPVEILIARIREGLDLADPPAAHPLGNGACVTSVAPDSG